MQPVEDPMADVLHQEDEKNHDLKEHPGGNCQKRD